MSGSELYIQKDWEHREFVELLTDNVKKITEFLNRFDLSTRHRLALLNEKLTKLERQMTFMESQLQTMSSDAAEA